MGTGLEGVDAVPEQGQLFPALSGRRMRCKSTDLMCGRTLPASFLCDLRITVPPVKHVTCSVGSTPNKHEELLRVCCGVYRARVQALGQPGIELRQMEALKSVRTREVTLPDLKVA